MLCSQFCLHVPFMFLSCMYNPFFVLLVSFKYCKIFALLVLHQSHRRRADDMSHLESAVISAPLLHVLVLSNSYAFSEMKIFCVFIFLNELVYFSTSSF